MGLPILGTGGAGMSGGGSPPAGDPSAPSWSTAVWKEGDTGLTASGTGFGDTQGSGNIRLTVQGKLEDDTITGDMTVTAWTSTLITFDVVMPQLSAVDWPGYYNATVINNSLNESTATQILIGPNQTTAAGQHASGFVELPGGGTDPATTMGAEAAGKSYLMTGTHVEKTITPQAGDTIIADSTASMDGSKDITEGVGGHSWAASGSSWVETNQNQSDSTGSFSITTPGAGSATENKKMADFYIGLSTQPQWKLARMSRNSSKSAIEGALSSSTLSSAIETIAGTEYVWITHVAHGLYFGECLKLSASATNGITLEGYYNVLQCRKNKYMVMADQVASASGTGGGGTLTYTYSIEVWFDSGNDDVYIAIDPTAASTNIRASTTASCINDSAADDVIIRGQDNDNPLLVLRHQSPDNAGAILGNSSFETDDWTLQFVKCAYNHGSGFSQRDMNRCQTWDFQSYFNGQTGITCQSSDNAGLEYHRTRLIGNSMRRTASATGAAVKWSNGASSENIDIIMDQTVCHNNWHVGIWPDSGTHGKFTRINSQFNGNAGIENENNDMSTVGGTGDFEISNCLFSENGWGETFPTGHNINGPASVIIRNAKGTAGQPHIFKDNVIQNGDELTGEPQTTNGAVYPIAIFGAEGSASRFLTDYCFVRNTRIVYLGSVFGTPKTGFGWFGNKTGQSSKMSSMQSTCGYGDGSGNGNSYWTKDAALTFLKMDLGTESWDSRTQTEWTDTDLYDANSTFNVSQATVPIVDTTVYGFDDMPTWTNILDVATVEV